MVARNTIVSGFTLAYIIHYPVCSLPQKLQDLRRWCLMNAKNFFSFSKHQLKKKNVRFTVVDLFLYKASFIQFDLVSIDKDLDHLTEAWDWEKWSKSSWKSHHQKSILYCFLTQSYLGHTLDASRPPQRHTRSFMWQKCIWWCIANAFHFFAKLISLLDDKRSLSEKVTKIFGGSWLLRSFLLELAHDDIVWDDLLGLLLDRHRRLRLELRLLVREPARSLGGVCALASRSSLIGWTVKRGLLAWGGKKEISSAAWSSICPTVIVVRSSRDYSYRLKTKVNGGSDGGCYSLGVYRRWGLGLGLWPSSGLVWAEQPFIQ